MFIINSFMLNDNITNNSKIDLNDIGMLIIFGPCLYSVLLIACLRIWLLFYTVNLGKFRLQRVWRCAIDTSCECENWYEYNLKRFGRAKYLFRWVILLVLILSGTSAYFKLDGKPYVPSIMAWSCAFIVALFGLIMWRKIRTIHFDTWGIKKELVITLKFGIISLIITSSLVKKLL